MSPTVPIATYRLQFNAGFTFADAARITPYLAALGISHAYASSYLAAVPGSTHGYDVADPTRLNPEIGTGETFEAWVGTLRAHGMGHLIDLVPNHMGIARSANPWWQDVLENGASSRYADVFDIDWHPLKSELEHKVLLPVLGDTYGAVLERQEIVLAYEAGTFSVRYFEQTFPIAPGTYARILAPGSERLLAEIGEESEDGTEFLSILTAIGHLPARHDTDRGSRAERDREKQVIKRRLAALAGRSPAVQAHIERAVRRFNGARGEAASFDPLDDLLDVQPYRLSYWRVAAEEINYRRFFDINELAAIRMEDPAVFEQVHAFVFSLLERGLIDGFRIDHVDGLFDPGDYLARLQARAAAARGGGEPFYVVVEKILGLDEELPDWPVAGTTGYDYLVQINGLFVDERNARAMTDVYERFTRLRVPYRELAYRGKQLVLRVSMASELNVLAHRLNRFSERHRHYRDYTLNSLNQAMREIIACFPVYRSYVSPRDAEPTARDREYIERAVRDAKRRNPNRPAAVYDFVRDLLLAQTLVTASDEQDERLAVIGKFQQVTSPVTAKGIEDTALYIYNRLVSLNEVGGEPDRFGVSPERLHRWLEHRAARWPHGLSATSTHDTKRSEDVRARLNVLSELPGAWKQATARWARINRRARTLIAGESYPSRNEEYLLYQTLIGSWPLGDMDAAGERDYAARIVAYMHKAMREAKVYTSWINPSEVHERAMQDFVEAVLDPAHAAFREDFLEFHRRVSQSGLYTSLAQLTLKITTPGVPDFYQGTELWDFSLVDPDNRRPVDYARREALLSELDSWIAADRLDAVARVMADPRDDRLKLFTTSALLRYRSARRALFERGDYAPVRGEGAAREHLFAFARGLGDQQVLIVVPRLLATLVPGAEMAPLGERTWGDSRLLFEGAAPGRPWRHVLTGETVGPDLRAADIFARFPVAVLEPLE